MSKKFALSKNVVLHEKSKIMKANFVKNLKNLKKKKKIALYEVCHVKYLRLRIDQNFRVVYRDIFFFLIFALYMYSEKNIGGYFGEIFKS